MPEISDFVYYILRGLHRTPGLHNGLPSFLGRTPRRPSPPRRGGWCIGARRTFALTLAIVYKVADINDPGKGFFYRKLSRNSKKVHASTITGSRFYPGPESTQVQGTAGCPVHLGPAGTHDTGFHEPRDSKDLSCPLSDRLLAGRRPRRMRAVRASKSLAGHIRARCAP